MKYTASVQLKKADTEGQVPASILDEYVRQELIRLVGACLKPHLIVRKMMDTTDCGDAHTDLVNFISDGVVLSAAEWNCVKEQLSHGFGSPIAGELRSLQTLIDSIETVYRGEH
ncbi:hypothetical protein [Spirosoma utsteinense]|uniref:Uncharacterized protein n=1 Tax=Spirosoma utsteinense TaxID=2585773 RepID=A0ABR6WEZ4_9BACT|nr:hypothetical protein [Spirosoma utsteinense]MBC3789161.1 hypothetical protein [Spirosoma utsteinense]MBC3795084.1 hypothetical protein [Spirosoma utsteinense]